MGRSHGYRAARAGPELHAAPFQVEHRLALEHVEARLEGVQVLVDVAVDERDQRQRHVRRAERAVDEPARRQAARAAGQGVGELDVLAPDEAISRPPVRELAGSRVAGHRGTAAGSTTAEDATAAARPGVPSALAVVGLLDEIGAAHVLAACDQQLVGREARDHVAAGRRHDDLFLDSRRRPAVRRGAVRLEREDHSFLERDRVLEGVDARDHRRLVEPHADPVPELEAEAGLLVREAELRGGRPHLRDLVRRHARPNEPDRRVEPFAALLVRIELRVADATHVERAVVARSVAHERVDDVEERLVSRPQQPVGEDVRMRVAAVARDGVDRLHLLRAHLEQQLVRAGHDLVLVDAGPQHPVDLLVDRVDEPGGLVEKRDLLVGLDLACLEEHLGSVCDLHSGALQRLDRDEVRHVDSERLVLEAGLAQLVRDLRTEPVRDPGLDGHRAAHRRDAGAEVLRREPGREQLVVAGGGPEVPEDRVSTAHEQRETRVLVPRPLADVRARDVADVVRVEEEHRPEVRGLERRLGSVEALLAQSREVDTLLPVHGARRVGGADGPASRGHRTTSWSGCSLTVESGVAVVSRPHVLRRYRKSAMKSSSAYPASEAARR